MALDVKKPKGYRKTWNGGEPPDIPELPAKVLYVVAVSWKEAHELAEQIGHRSRRAAEKHLSDVQAPPTDPDYAKQYRIFIVPVEAALRRAAGEQP